MIHVELLCIHSNIHTYYGSNDWLDSRNNATRNVDSKREGVTLFPARSSKPDHGCCTTRASRVGRRALTIRHPCCGSNHKKSAATGQGKLPPPAQTELIDSNLKSHALFFWVCNMDSTQSFQPRESAGGIFNRTIPPPSPTYSIIPRSFLGNVSCTVPGNVKNRKLWPTAYSNGSKMDPTIHFSLFRYMKPYKMSIRVHFTGI